LSSLIRPKTLTNFCIKPPAMKKAKVSFPKTLKCSLCPLFFSRASHWKTHLVKHFLPDLDVIVRQMLGIAPAGVPPRVLNCPMNDCHWKKEQICSFNILVFHVALAHNVLETVLPQNILDSLKASELKNSSVRRDRRFTRLESHPEPLPSGHISQPLHSSKEPQIQPPHQNLHPLVVSSRPFQQSLLMDHGKLPQHKDNLICVQLPEGKNQGGDKQNFNPPKTLSQAFNGEVPAGRQFSPILVRNGQMGALQIWPMTDNNMNKTSACKVTKEAAFPAVDK